VLQGTLSSRIDLLGGKGGFLPGLMTDGVATKQHVAGFGPAQAAAVTFIIQASRQGEPVGLRATLTPGEMDEILNDFAAGLQTVPGCLPDLAAYLTPVPRVNWSKMLLFTYVRQIVAAHNADLLNPVQCFPVPAALQGATPRARWVNYLLTCAKEAAGLLPAGPNGQMPIPVINPTVTSASTTAILAVLLRATAAELTNPHYTVVGALSPKEMIEGIILVLSTLTAPRGIFDILERVIALLRFHMDWFHEDKSGEESQLMMAEKAFSQLIRLGKTPSLHPTVVGRKQTACWWCQSGNGLPLLVRNRLPVGGARVAKSYRCWYETDCLLVVPEWQSPTIVGKKQTSCWWCQIGKVLPLLVRIKPSY
jgi:hypothetical protein